MSFSCSAFHAPFPLEVLIMLLRFLPGSAFLMCPYWIISGSHTFKEVQVFRKHTTHSRGIFTSQGLSVDLLKEVNFVILQ